MIGDITIGQYFPGNSFIHKLDARVKIILTLAVIISLFICKNFYSLLLSVAFTLLIVLVGGISLKRCSKA